MDEAQTEEEKMHEAKMHEAKTVEDVGSFIYHLTAPSRRMTCPCILQMVGAGAGAGAGARVEAGVEAEMGAVGMVEQEEEGEADRVKLQSNPARERAAKHRVGFPSVTMEANGA